MTSRPVLSKLGLGVLVAALIVACGNPEDDLLAAEGEWSSRGIDDYNLTLQIHCFCGAAGSYDVTVRDGKVIDIMTDRGVIEMAGAMSSDWFTVEGLFDIVRENLNADQLGVRYAEEGYPSAIEIDVDRDESDDSLSVSTVLQPG